MAGRKKLKLGIPEKEDSGDLFAEKDEAAPKKGKSASKSKQPRDEAREDKKAAATELEAPSDSVKNISAFLRNVRRRQKVDLRDVAAKLNIRLIHLQAIEEGRFADLPGPTYVIGFVRAYAEFLKLDQQAVVAFQTEQGVRLSVDAHHGCSGHWDFFSEGLFLSKQGGASQ